MTALRLDREPTTRWLGPRRLRVKLVCLALAVLASPGVARADEADDRISHGVELREQGKDEEALAEFRRAFELRPTPHAQAQIALAEQALGLWTAAESDLQAAMQATDDPWITKNRAALDGALATIGKRIGTLELRFDPAPPQAGGEIWIDGARRSTLPLAAPLRVEAGQRAVEVRAPGYYPVAITVTVPGGGIARETIALHPAPSTSRPTTHDSGAASSPASEAPPSSRTIVEPAPSGGAVRSVGWVFLGTSAALLATGVVGQIARQGQVASYNDDPTCPGQGSPSQPPACQDLMTSAQTWNTVSIVGFIAGGVFASSGIVLVLLGSSSGGAGAHTAALPACGPFGCGLRF